MEGLFQVAKHLVQHFLPDKPQRRVWADKGCCAVRMVWDWCRLNLHQRTTRANRLAELLDLQEELEFASTVMHESEFMLGGAPSRLGARVRRLGIPGPEGNWLDEHMGIHPPCEMWVDHLLYACEIRCLHLAESAWATVQKQWKRQREVDARPDWL